MSRSYYRYSILFLFLVLPLVAVAQDSIVPLRSYSRILIENPWIASSNKAGNIFSSFIPDGEFELQTSMGKGDLKLTQLSPNEKNYSFKAHKMIKLTDIVFDGGVEYLNQQQQDVGWGARMNPETHNPYMLADSIFGLYSKDYVNLFGSFGYSLSDKMLVGVGVDYLVGDGARIKDPRPVNDMFSLEVSPSIIYILPGVKLGANFLLRKGREKIAYTTIENSTTYRFFRMFGLGNGARTVNSWSYSRNYYNSGLGGELQAEYRIGKMKLFSELGYDYSLESGEDGSSNPRKGDAGDYKESLIKFNTSLVSKNTFIHAANLFLNVSIGDGIEFIQEPYLENSITYYRTIAEVSKFSFTSINPGISYQLVKPYNDFSDRWKIKANIELDHRSSVYLLEANQSITNISPSLSFDHTAYMKKSTFTYSIDGACIINLGNELVQQRPYIAQQNIAAWDNIVYPDHTLLSSTSYSFGTHVRYGRHVNLTKNVQNMVYIDLNVNFRRAVNEEWAANKHWEFYGIKLGITY